MKEFDKQNFYILLGASLIWFYFIFNPNNLWANVSMAATAFSLYIFVTKIYEERSGFFSTLIFLSMLGAGLGANFSGRGALLTLLLTLIFMSYLCKRYWCIYLLLALGIHFYGFWVGVFVFTIIFMHCLTLGRIDRLMEIHFIRGILLVIVGLMPFHLQEFHNFTNGLLPQMLTIVSLLPQQNYSAHLNGVKLIVSMILLIFPWFILFLKSIFVSISDSKNEEFENHILLHLWWVLGLGGIIYLGQDFYPLAVTILPSVAILAGWSCQRLEKNFNPTKNISPVPVWNCLITFILLGIAWHYLGYWNPGLSFEANLVAVLLVIIALIAIYVYYKYEDFTLFLLIQILAGVVEICLFYIYFYPMLSI